MGDAIDELIEEFTVDAYRDYEQLSSFCEVLADEAVPFAGTLVGVDDEVIEVDFDGDERRGLLARCRRGGEDHTVPLLDVVPADAVPSRTRQHLEAYWRWSGVDALGGHEWVTSSGC